MSPFARHYQIGKPRRVVRKGMRKDLAESSPVTLLSLRHKYKLEEIITINCLFSQKSGSGTITGTMYQLIYEISLSISRLLQPCNQFWLTCIRGSLPIPLSFYLWIITTL